MRNVKFILLILGFVGLTSFRPISNGPGIEAGLFKVTIMYPGGKDKSVGHFYCYNVAEYNQAISKNIDAILTDIKKYTNIQPVILIREIKQVK